MGLARQRVRSLRAVPPRGVLEELAHERVRRVESIRRILDSRTGKYRSQRFEEGEAEVPDVERRARDAVELDAVEPGDGEAAGPDEGVRRAGEAELCWEPRLLIWGEAATLRRVVSGVVVERRAVVLLVGRARPSGAVSLGGAGVVTGGSAANATKVFLGRRHFRADEAELVAELALRKVRVELEVEQDRFAKGGVEEGEVWDAQDCEDLVAESRDVVGERLLDAAGGRLAHRAVVRILLGILIDPARRLVYFPMRFLTVPAAAEQVSRQRVLHAARFGGQREYGGRLTIEPPGSFRT